MLKSGATLATLESAVVTANTCTLVVRVKFELNLVSGDYQLLPANLYHLEGSDAIEAIRKTRWDMPLDQPDWLEGKGAQKRLTLAGWQQVVVYYQTQTGQLFKRMPRLPTAPTLASTLMIAPLKLKVHWETRRHVQTTTHRAARPRHHASCGPSAPDD